MIEPRRGFHMLQRRDSQERHALYSRSNSATDNNNNTEQLGEPLLIVLEPEPLRPIHPALEYEEVVVDASTIREEELDAADQDGQALLPQRNSPQNQGQEQDNNKRPAVILCDAKLLLSFVGLIVFGSVNAVSLKLQAIPMYNYPSFLSIFTNAMYIPICFAYIIPAARLGWFQSSSRGNTADDNNNNNRQDQDEERIRESEEELESSEEPETNVEHASSLDNDSEVDDDDIDNNDDTDNNDSLLERLLADEDESALLAPSETLTASEATQQQQQRYPSASQSLTYWDLAIMGFLDSLATTMQLFSAVYLPGPLLILLPQAAVPLSLLVSLMGQRQSSPSYRWTQYFGAAAVVLGIIILIEPLQTLRRSPDFYCEAIDLDNDCTVCKWERDRETCLAHASMPPNEKDGGDNDAPAATAFQRSLRVLGHDTTPNDSLCQWIPFEESSREEEILTAIWSLVLVASCAPMTLSILYKEWAMGGSDAEQLTTNAHQHHQADPIYLNGWIAVFQLFFAIPLTFLASWLSSPSLNFGQDLWDGLRCYLQGMGTVATGCHPDTLCGTYSFWFVNLHLFSTLGYSFFMMYSLKYGTTTLFFLALTIMVPLGTTAFVLPFMPEAITPCISDTVGSIAIVVGLVLYRFFDTKTVRADSVLPMDEEGGGDSDEVGQPVCRAFFALQKELPSSSGPPTAVTPMTGDV